MIPVICPRCGNEYQERDEAAALRPDRCCQKCWSAQANCYRERVPDQPKHTAGTCRSCGRAIVWMKTASGKNMPVNSETVEPGDELFDPKRHVSHFSDCPQAAEFRRAR